MDKSAREMRSRHVSVYVANKCIAVWCAVLLRMLSASCVNDSCSYTINFFRLKIVDFVSRFSAPTEAVSVRAAKKKGEKVVRFEKRSVSPAGSRLPVVSYDWLPCDT